VIGAIATSWLETFDIKQAVFYAEFDVEQLFRMADDRVRYREPSKFPQVRRDLALLIPSDMPFASIEKLAFQHGGALLRDINLFDVYRDKKMGDHIKSYAVSFTFMDETKTLVDADVDAQMLKLMTILEQELKAVIRK
jgi:phenylalanyl-tRNA synthetase beta chain